MTESRTVTAPRPHPDRYRRSAPQDEVPLDMGRRMVRLRLPGLGPATTDLRLLVVLAVIAVLLVTVLVFSVGTGEVEIGPVRVLRALVGQGSELDVLVVHQWRLPRALMAIVLGAMLGIGGGIFQSLTRNPLGSPDVIGFGTGAYTGALVVILVLGGGYLATAAGALVGGVATALVVYLLSVARGSGRRGVQGFRLIIIGIGVAAMLSAFNTWMILRVEVEDAMRVAIWGAGSLNGVTWEQLAPTSVIAVAIVLGTAVLASRMHVMELGDDSAAALGIRTEATRLSLIIVGIATVALVSATAGPISFVALAAPQIARRLARSAGIALVPAAATGSLLLLASDYLAQRIHPMTPLPVGVVTVSVGGVYLIWLLINEGRKSRS